MNVPLPGARISFSRSEQTPFMSLWMRRKNMFIFQSEQSSFAFVLPHLVNVWIEWSKRCNTLARHKINMESLLFAHQWWKKEKLTGICSTIGSSLAIVPARSHELVMLTSDWNSSAQKYPHVVPINCNLVDGNERNEWKGKRKFLIQSGFGSKDAFSPRRNAAEIADCERIKTQLTCSSATKKTEFLSNTWSTLRLDSTRQMRKSLSHVVPTAKQISIKTR